MAAVPPLGPWVRFIITFGTAVWQNWDSLVNQFERHDDHPTADVFGYKSEAIFRWRNSSGGAFSDPGQFGIHWINVTDDALDHTWTTDDFAAVESALTTFWTSAAGYIPQSCQLQEIRHYAFGPGIGSPNPAARVTILGSPITGGSTGSCPRQTATTVSIRTALRRHWGRFYVPIGSSSTFDTYGRLSTGAVDGIAGYARTLLTSPGTEGIYPVVWDRARSSALGMSQIAVDDVADIVRRRRPPTTLYRKTFTS